MESKFRPIPVTILDFLAILLPGFVWLVLIMTAFEIARGGPGGAVPSPVVAWKNMLAAVKSADTWLAPISVGIIALLLGYLLKSPATTLSERIINFLRRRRREYRGANLKDLSFPYSFDNRGKVYYVEVEKLFSQKLGFSPEEFPGSHVFAASKRYLRLVSPTLWEETERREAEVRMTGALFLASIVSALLGALTLLLQLAGRLPAGDRTGVAFWLLLSLAMIYVVGMNFIKLRVTEVSYTYMNTLMAHHFQPRAEDGQGAAGQP